MVISGAAVAAGLAAGSVVVVSVFCSQAARSAALAKMQMYFFIVIGLRRNIPLIHQSEQGRFSALPDFLFGKLSRANELKRRLVLHPVSIGHGLTREPAVARVDPPGQGGLLPACAVQAEIGQQLDIAKSDVR